MNKLNAFIIGLVAVGMLTGGILALSGIGRAEAQTKPARAPIVIPQGQTTIGENQWDNVNLAPIPSDFFNPDSEPFTGVIELCPPTTPDTIIERKEKLGPLFPNGHDTIEIELIQLYLVSCEPITVSVPNTTLELDWDVHLTHAPEASHPSGEMTVVRTDSHGGTFASSFFDVFVQIEFTTIVTDAELEEILGAGEETGIETGTGTETGTVIGTPADENNEDSDTIESSDLGLPSGGSVTVTERLSADHLSRKQIAVKYEDISFSIGLGGRWTPSSGRGKPNMRVDNVNGAVNF
ncbi:hypothetical protein HYS91_06005 [Candidatus Daviesbacteria bacterium]|nr:hypothetical protein [Candidatus Daviesbacteria bacterium]